MSKSESLLLLVASLLLLSLSLWLVVENIDVEVSVNLWLWRERLSLAWPLGLMALTIGGCVFLAARRWMTDMEGRHKRTGRELERREVSREAAESKVKVLEQKVETLEKALREALKHNQR